MMSLFQVTYLILTVQLLLPTHLSLNTYTISEEASGEIIWRSTSDFVPQTATAYGEIPLGQIMSIEFDFKYQGRTSTSNSQFFRIGASALGKANCDGQNSKYPSLWLKWGALDTAILDVQFTSGAIDCDNYHYLYNYGDLNLNADHHIIIALNNTNVTIQITGGGAGKSPFTASWLRDPTPHKFLNNTNLFVWWAGDKTAGGDFPVADGTFSNIILKTNIFTFAPTMAPTSPSINPTNTPSKSPVTQPPSSPPTNAPSQTPTTPSSPPTLSPSKSPTDPPTNIPTKSPSDIPTQTPTKSPTRAPTDIPTHVPSVSPTTASPTISPTRVPTAVTIAPTNAPTPVLPTTANPSVSPSEYPTRAPTHIPSGYPTKPPTDIPSKYPTKSPTNVPSVTPSQAPTEKGQTKYPSVDPTISPTRNPSVNPTTAVPTTSVPTKSPTLNPSDGPSKSPTKMPTSSPTKNPSYTPSKSPTHFPTFSPSHNPTQSPTKPPSIHPTMIPSTPPSQNPSKSPTHPTANPSLSPTTQPSTNPSLSPSTQPSTHPSQAPMNQSFTATAADPYTYIFYGAIAFVAFLLVGMAFCCYCRFKPPKEDVDFSFEMTGHSNDGKTHKMKVAIENGVPLPRDGMHGSVPSQTVTQTQPEQDAAEIVYNSSDEDVLKGAYGGHIKSEYTHDKVTPAMAQNRLRTRDRAPTQSQETATYTAQTQTHTNHNQYGNNYRGKQIGSVTITSTQQQQMQSGYNYVADETPNSKMDHTHAHGQFDVQDVHDVHGQVVYDGDGGGDGDIHGAIQGMVNNPSSNIYEYYDEDDDAEYEEESSTDVDGDDEDEDEDSDSDSDNDGVDGYNPARRYDGTGPGTGPGHQYEVDVDEQYLVEMITNDELRKKVEIDLREREMNALKDSDEEYAHNIFHAGKQNTEIMNDIIQEMNKNKTGDEDGNNKYGDQYAQ